MLVSEESVFLLVKREGRRQQVEGIAVTLKTLWPRPDAALQWARKVLMASSEFHYVYVTATSGGRRTLPSLGTGIKTGFSRIIPQRLNVLPARPVLVQQRKGVHIVSSAGSSGFISFSKPPIAPASAPT